MTQSTQCTNEIAFQDHLHDAFVYDISDMQTCLAFFLSPQSILLTFHLGHKG